MNRCMLGNVTEGYLQLLEFVQCPDGHGKFLKSVEVQLAGEKGKKERGSVLVASV